MNEELTKEVLEAIVNCDCSACIECPAQSVCAAWTRQKLATALLEERAKPKVWDDVPELVNIVDVYWSGKTGEILGCKKYTRELPKTRIDEIADEMWHEINKGVTGVPNDIIKRWLKKYAEELKGEV